VLRILALALAALVIVSCGGSASDTECEQVADHMLDLFTEPTAPPGETLPSPPAPGSSAAKTLEAERKKFRDNATARDHILARCKQGMSSSRAECILRAANEAELAACGQ
jgi:hypothetical protein